MNWQIRHWLTEKTVFFSLLAFHIFLFCSVKFYPSMDGPSHLYNSNLIVELLKGNSQGISDFFELNHKILPNWTGFAILAIFNSFLPAWMAEKILLIFYISGISISFRLLIKQLCPENLILSIFIFPFAFSFLFHLGFYNYAISFIFLFFTIFYWLKTYKSSKPGKYLILALLLILVYFSAILTFYFTGFCLGLFAIAYAIKEYNICNEKNQVIKKLIKELLLLILISLPGLILSIIFFESTSFPGNAQKLSVNELIKWILDIRCIIVFDYPGEEIITRQFLYICVAIMAISLFIRFYQKGRVFSSEKIRKSDVFLIPALLSLILLFIIPNNSSAGMMSDRFCLLFYIFIIIWIASQPLPKNILKIMTVLIIAFHLGLVFKRHNGAIKELNRDAKEICMAANPIKENSIVLPVNLSENWIEPHFSNYLGIDKPIVILENYEATVGWFPIKLNLHQMPNLRLGNADLPYSIDCLKKSNSLDIDQIDYVFLYGQLNKIDNPEYVDLKSILKLNYKLTYLSDNKYVAVYKLVK